MPDSLLMGPEGGFHEVKLVVQPGVFLPIVSEDGEPTFMRVLDDDTVRVPEKYGETWPWPPVSFPCTADRRGWTSYSADGDTTSRGGSSSTEGRRSVFHREALA